MSNFIWLSGIEYKHILVLFYWAFPPEKGGRAIRYNLLFVPHKRIFAAIPNAM
jgi:hypothetical protein